jgi:hypothetical protein
VLEKLLERIERDGIISSAELARGLDVSQELVESMLADLARAGYLSPVDGCPQGQCSGCPVGRGCNTRRGKGWVRNARTDRMKRKS